MIIVAVKDDGRDPHLLANLQRIGQVQVPRGKVKFQPSNEMLNILQARRRDSDAEQEASQAAQAASGGVRVSGQIRNRMGASVLVSLLDERKACQSRKDLEELAHAYDIDVSVMETLARFVNAPSIAAGSRLRAQNERKDEVEPNDDVSTHSAQRKRLSDFRKAPPRIDAIWTDPNLQDFKEIREYCTLLCDVNSPLHSRKVELNSCFSVQ